MGARELLLLSFVHSLPLGGTWQGVEIVFWLFLVSDDGERKGRAEQKREKRTMNESKWAALEE